MMDDRVNEPVMADEPRRPVDDEIAALTDALLRGETPATASDEAAPLLDVARRLALLIAPREAPSAEFERRLRTTTEQAWAARAARARRTNRRVWGVLAAAAAVVLLAILLVPPDATFPLFLAGAAVDGPPQVVEIPWRAMILCVGLAGLGVYWWYRRRPA